MFVHKHYSNTHKERILCVPHTARRAFPVRHDYSNLQYGTHIIVLLHEKYIGPGEGRHPDFVLNIASKKTFDPDILSAKTTKVGKRVNKWMKRRSAEN